MADEDALTQGRWKAGHSSRAGGFWEVDLPNYEIILESRADVSDLIALLERVRERLPEK